jgi:Stress responsive A/B Barrel Domain
MCKTVVLGVVTALVAGGFVAFFGQSTTEAGKKAEMMFSRDVYFSLTDNSPKAKQALVDLCKKHLSKHSGEVFFAVGTLAEDRKRGVTDCEFDVALHIVFKDLAAHDRHTDDERYKQFLEAAKPNWKKVRVFDSYVTQ